MPSRTLTGWLVWSVLLGWLVGCAAPPPANEPMADLPPCDLDIAEVHRYAGFEDLGRLMVFRQSVCAEAESDRAQAVQPHRDNYPQSALLIDLVLASCEPNQTPGLFAEAVRAARDAPEAPPGFFAFLDLLQTQHSAYMRLDDRRRATEERLEAIVEGIRAIEAEMGTDNGRSNAEEIIRD